jgi:hypothetical protein
MICSNWQLFTIEIDKLIGTFKKIGYPKNILDKITSNFMEKIHAQNKTIKNKTSDLTRKSIFVSLPYIGAPTGRVRTKLKLLIKKLSPYTKHRIVFYNHFTIDCLFKKALKPIVPSLQRNNVVYMIGCKQCKASYIGKTKRKLVTRLCEHRAALKGRGFSSLAEHCFSTSHNIDWDNVSIITTDLHDYRLIYKESFAIKKHKPSLNDNLSSVPLHVFI